MSTQQTIEATTLAMRGVLGALCLALVAKRGVTPNRVAQWVRQLRAAANKLEELL